MGENKIFIILPCYNEEVSLRALLKHIDDACSKLDYTIIVVDDGSEDQTYDILLELRKKIPIVVERHLRNMGLQAALETGFRVVNEIARDDDAIIIMDADLTHDPKSIPTMLSHLDRGFDLVIGSRYVGDGGQVGVPFYRVVLSRGVCFLGRVLLRLPIRDVTSGFRGYKAKVVKRLICVYGDDFVNSEGFEVVLELLAKAYRLGAKTVEIPVFLDYSKKRSRSRLAVPKTICDYLKLFLRGPRKWHHMEKTTCERKYGVSL